MSIDQIRIIGSNPIKKLVVVLKFGSELILDWISAVSITFQISDVIIYIRMDSDADIVFGCNNAHPNGFGCGYCFWM